jgi:hypothetical protein
LSSKDLRRNPIAIFNSILSARLICVLDFIFAETTPVRRASWIADCGITPILVRIFFAINNGSCNSERLSPRAQKNLKSPAFDNVYSVPVQAA